MKPGGDEREAAPQPPLRVRINRLNGTTKDIPESGGFQPALILNGYPVPHPDDAKDHLEMAFAIARETICHRRSERAVDRPE